MEAADKRPFVDLSFLQPCTDSQIPFFMWQPKRNGKLRKMKELSSSASSREDLQPERIVALATHGDALRTEKVRRIKAQIAQGTYYVATEAVAKSMLRSEVSRLLGKS